MVDRARATEEHPLVPGGSYTSWIARQAHSQSQASIGGAKSAKHVANLVFAVECGFVEADEAVAWSHVIPDVLVGRYIRQPDLRARWKRPCPRRRPHVLSTHGVVEPHRLIHDVRHLGELLTKNDRSQVRIARFSRRIDQHGLGFERACSATEK